VLRQGIRREHVFAVCATCALSDAVLILGGVGGIGAATAAAPWLLPALRWGGVAFLTVYGARAFRAAWIGGAALTPTGQGAVRLWPVLATCLALTWLNPHVWLDTVVLVGGIAAQFGAAKWVFGTGAALASLVFFFALGYGARLLAPVFARPAAWRVLDALVGCLLWTIAASLAFGAL